MPLRKLQNKRKSTNKSKNSTRKASSKKNTKKNVKKKYKMRGGDEIPDNVSGRGRQKLNTGFYNWLQGNESSNILRSPENDPVLTTENNLKKNSLPFPDLLNTHAYTRNPITADRLNTKSINTQPNGETYDVRDASLGSMQDPEVQPKISAYDPNPTSTFEHAPGFGYQTGGSTIESLEERINKIEEKLGMKN